MIFFSFMKQTNIELTFPAMKLQQILKVGSKNSFFLLFQAQIRTRLNLCWKSKTILQLIIQFTVKKFKFFIFFKQLTKSILRITQIQPLDLFKSKEVVCEIYQSYYPSFSYYSYRFQSQSVYALLYKAEYVFYSCSGLDFTVFFAFCLSVKGFPLYPFS